MEFRLPYPHIISSFPDLLMGLAFLVTWIDPAALGSDMVPSLSLVMLMEFIIIHSSGFMGGVVYNQEPKATKVKMLLGFGVFYFLFVIGFSLGFRSWWPVITFTGLLINRMLSVLVGQVPTGKERQFVTGQWALNAVCYLVSVFVVILLPVPALGVSSENFAGYSMTGDFIEQPEKMMAWGMVYFTAIGLFEMKNITLPVKEAA